MLKWGLRADVCRRSWIASTRTWWPKWKRWANSRRLSLCWLTTTRWSRSPRATAHRSVTGNSLTLPAQPLRWSHSALQTWTSLPASRLVCDSLYTTVLPPPAWFSNGCVHSWEATHDSCSLVALPCRPPRSASWMCACAAPWARVTAWRRPAGPEPSARVRGQVFLGTVTAVDVDLTGRGRAGVCFSLGLQHRPCWCSSGLFRDQTEGLGGRWEAGGNNREAKWSCWSCLSEPALVFLRWLLLHRQAQPPGRNRHRRPQRNHGLLQKQGQNLQRLFCGRERPAVVLHRGYRRVPPRRLPQDHW